MNGRIFFWSLTSALAGFLFGFDTVVISGAEKTIQALWGLSPALHGKAIASALYGTVAGSLLGGWLADRFGRKATLLWIGVLYFVGAVGSGLAPNVATFIVARVIGGLGIGISTVVAPMYISEIAPPKYRGRLAGMFQFNIVFGILIAYVSNALLAGVGENAWRWMLGVAAFPSFLYAAFCIGLPESPRWLLSRKGDREAGIRVLQRIEPEVSQAEIAARADAILAASSEKAQGLASTGRPSWIRRVGQWLRQVLLTIKRLRRPILLAILIAFFNQMSGINAILYFAPRIFELTGLAANAALLQSIGIGVTNLVFTFVGLWLIDRLGRRTLLYIGSFGYIASLGLAAWAFFTGHFSIVPACIFAFIAAHAVGQGAVIWVFISEIFPNRHRAEGQTLGSSTHWIFAALLTTFFPRMVASFPPGYVFSFFAGMMVLQLIWVKTMVPETKGVPLEQIQKQLGIA
ncbi:MAG TPA: sugar porter family MFS transporter [Candidatus Binatus sp.]|jgi:SP family arabinose:H+ symporter-like MFS transporter|nr:sugar porter family MFS transporter [Candidatus Binatus sp.]